MQLLGDCFFNPNVRSPRIAPGRRGCNAKGRQWPVVVLVNVIEGVSPHERNTDGEEERVFYVGATRASDMLHLVAPRWRHSRTTEISRYLKPHLDKLKCVESL